MRQSIVFELKKEYDIVTEKKFCYNSQLRFSYKVKHRKALCLTVFCDFIRFLLFPSVWRRLF